MADYATLHITMMFSPIRILQLAVVQKAAKVGMMDLTPVMTVLKQVCVMVYVLYVLGKYQVISEKLIGSKLCFFITL